MSEPSALKQILQPGGLTAVYQPFYRVNGSAPKPYGFEALSRGPRGSNFESAKILFDYVRLKREESLVDRACVALGLHGAGPLPAGCTISVNVHASTLGRDHDFVDFLCSTADAAGIDCDRLIIEIVEHAPPWDGVSFLTALDQLRARGARIALDDVGLGQSNFKMLLDVCPKYLKVDRYFIEGCHTDARRRAVITALLQLASQFDAEVVAEGVSTTEDAGALRDLGVTLMQGYLYARPMPAEFWSASAAAALA